MHVPVRPNFCYLQSVLLLHLTSFPPLMSFSAFRSLSPCLGNPCPEWSRSHLPSLSSPKLSPFLQALIFSSKPSALHHSSDFQFNGDFLMLLTSFKQGRGEGYSIQANFLFFLGRKIVCTPTMVCKVHGHSAKSNSLMISLAE